MKCDKYKCRNKPHNIVLPVVCDGTEFSREVKFFCKKHTKQAMEILEHFEFINTISEDK